MPTEAELEQAVIERWTGKSSAPFRIRAKVGASPILKVSRWKTRLGGQTKLITTQKVNLVPVDNDNDWQWAGIEPSEPDIELNLHAFRNAVYQDPNLHSIITTRIK